MGTSVSAKQIMHGLIQQMRLWSDQRETAAPLRHLLSHHSRNTKNSSKQLFGSFYYFFEKYIEGLTIKETFF